MGLRRKKKRKMAVSLFFVLFACSAAGITAQETAAPAESGTKTVVIEQARKTEYRKDPETGSELIYLTGGVVLSVTEDTSLIVISADTLTFNRERDMVYAGGSVTFKRYTDGSQKDGPPEEELSGSSLLFNVSSMEGIFDDGTVVRNGEGAPENAADSRLLVSADAFGKNTSGTVSFERGVLTFCDEPDPHWKIRASRIWLLPGNEFAFLNALLYVGEIPVLYLPFFYFPKDEMIFNPVFGYRARAGYFTQTTTYIIGRKPADQTAEQAGFFSLTSASALQEQERQGLFLHNLGTELKTVPKNSLKVMADIYSNLGGMTGVEGSFYPEGPVSRVGFKALLGFSRNLYPVNGYDVYVPYDSSGAVTWNSSNLFGLELPFRYAFDVSFDLAGTYAKLSASLPLYSDPFFNSDFLERRETMDWFGFLTENGSTQASSSGTAGLSSYMWKINGNVRTSFDILKPYVKTLELSSFSSSITFNSRTAASLPAELQNVSPDRTFFFPSTIIPFQATISIAGDIVTYPSVQPAAIPQESVPGLTPPAEWQQEDGGKDTDSVPWADSFLPALQLSVPRVVPFSGLKYSLGYSIVPKFSSTVNYTASKWTSADQVSWQDFSAVFYSVSALTSLNSLVSWRDNFVSMSNRLQFDTAWQDHPEISAKFNTPAQIDQIHLNDYAARKVNLNLLNTVSLKPFVMTGYFKNTSLLWNSDIKLLRSSFSGTVGQPRWEYLPPGWDEKSFNTHNVVLVIDSSLGPSDGFRQTLTLQSNLPPLLDSYTGKFSLLFPFVSFSAENTIRKESLDTGKWTNDPLRLSLGISLFDKKLSITQNYVYDIEKRTPSSYSADVGFEGVKLAYSMQYTTPYSLSKDKGWTAGSEQKFLPVFLSASYSRKKDTFYLWKDRVSIAPGISVSLYANMIRPTESYFVFDPSLTFSIYDFLDITFSVQTRNDVIFRYVQDAAGFSPKIPGETNVFVDLFNSFAFWDREKRQTSGFKMKSLTLTVSHDLHDWQLKSEFTIKPRLITDMQPYRYDFNPYFSLSVIWKPFQGMKTTIVDEYGTFILNP